MIKQALHRVSLLLVQWLHRTFITVVLTSLRFLMHLWVRNRTERGASKQRKRDLQTMKVMAMLEELLTNTSQLTNNRREGPNPIYTEAGQNIVHAFVACRHYQEEDDYYLFVAEAWVEELERKWLRTLLIWVTLLSAIFIGIVTLIQLWILLETFEME